MEKRQEVARHSGRRGRGHQQERGVLTRWRCPCLKAGARVSQRGHAVGSCPLAASCLPLLGLVVAAEPLVASLLIDGV